MTLTANPDSATTPAGTPVTIAVLANDTLDGSPVALGDLTGLPTIVTPPAQGTAVVQPDGTVTYTPPAGFCGQVTFEYQIEAPDAPAGACLCVEFGEGSVIWSGVPDAFDREQPLYAEAGDETYECSFSTWHSAWVGNIPQEWQGRLVTLAQGSLTVQTAVCAVDGTPLMADWLMPEGPVMWRSWLYSEEITVVLNGQTYEGSVDEYTNITWDVEPPVTWPGPGGTEIIPLDSLTTGSGDTYCGVIHSVQGA